MKNIIITGAANGVGKTLATMLKKENLILVDIEKESLKKLAKELEQNYFVCDVSDTKQVKKIKDFVVKTFNNKLDCLINCAGLWTKGQLSQLDTDHYAKLNKLDILKQVINTNVFGLISMITELSPIMIKQKFGQIININSQSGVLVEEFCPVYNASKHGSYAYRKAIQADLAKHNIKITDVCPGLIKTDFYVRANDKLPDEIMNLGLEPEEVAKTVIYVLNLPHEVTIPSIEIRHIKNY
ncbi:MAG: SDR family oxidoreductase [Clostridia bacterium]|nr:SDR family oxidoreductase [Clostridia bacterium]